MDNIQDITKKLLAFRQARDWGQFHNPKDCAISLCLEAAEVLEHFQWKNPEELKHYLASHKGEVGEELADVFNWILLLSHDLGIDIAAASHAKIAKNDKKYPVAKVKGRHAKYDQYK